MPIVYERKFRMIGLLRKYGTADFDMSQVILRVMTLLQDDLAFIDWIGLHSTTGI